MLANAVWLLHMLVLLFIVIAPFTNGEFALLMHFIMAPGLLVHWATNMDTCALTLVEARLRGVPCSQTFLDGLVGSLYRLPGSYSAGGLATVATLLLWCVTAYKVYSRGLCTKVLTSLREAYIPDRSRSIRTSSRDTGGRIESSAGSPSAGASSPLSPPLSPGPV